MESLSEEHHSNPVDGSTEKSPHQILMEKKMKLRKDIQDLEELNFQIECSLNISKFGDIRHLLKPPEEESADPSKRIPDVETQYTDELFKLTGMHCTKFLENEYVFSFLSPGNFIGKDAYAVQITDASTEPKIGKWVMPISIDIANILLETPLENVVDLKPFLANCKHHIDCYTDRVQQYNELKKIVTELSGCWLDSSLGHTTISLKFFGVEILEYEESHNIILYLIYKPNRVRPHKIKIDPLNSKTLAESQLNKLKNYFKYFKSHDLKPAFRKTVDAKDTSVVWKQGEDQDALEFSDSSTSGSTATIKTVQRKTKKSPKRQGKKRKVAETSQLSQGSEGLERSSDHLDSERVDDPGEQVMELGDRGVEKTVENKTKRQKATVNKTPVADKASSAPKPSKKQPQQKKNPPKNIIEPNANVSKRNLRQSIIEFQVRRPEEVDEAHLHLENEPLAQRIILSVDENTTKKKPESNKTLLANREFGTSTPVSQFNRLKKRFVNESIEMSPIVSKRSIDSKEKKLANKPG